MKYVVKQNTPLETPPQTPHKPDDVVDISVDRLIDDGLLVLHREIHQLKLLSAKGKLEASAARDLRDHVKLLFDLKKREEDSLIGVTDEEIEAKAKEIIK
jgi:hypothetical protein